ncbi:MAG: DNA translocase FtsK [Pseudomonadota bacterium]
MTAYFGDSRSTPLVPQEVSERLRRRLIQLGGLALVGLGALLAACLVSFDIDDPSQFSASDKLPSNWLGAPGAILAAPALRWFGVAGAGLAVLLAVWGLRVVLGRGNHRVWGRIPAMPLALVVLPIFASTHVPWQSWPLETGLGGLFGDRALLSLFDLMPMAPDRALMFLSILLGLITMALWALSLGLDRAEARAFGRWLIHSTWQAAVQVVTLSLRLAWLTAAAAMMLSDRAVAAVKEWRAKPRSERLDPAEPTGSWRQKRSAEAAAQTAGPNAATAKIMRPVASVQPAGPAEMDGQMPELEGGPDQASDRAGGLLTRALGILRRDAEPPAEGPEIDSDRVLGVAEDGARAVRFSRLHRSEPEAGPLPPPASVPDGPVSDEEGLSAAIRALKYGEPVGAPDIDPDSDDADYDQRPPIARAPRNQAKKSRRAVREAQPGLFDEQDPEAYVQPPFSLLQRPEARLKPIASDAALEENARMLETVLEDYGVRGEIIAVKPGPVVTLYELEPAPGLKASRVIGLADDIARSMSALAARVSTVPGRSVIGIELPNPEREKVLLREVLEAPHYGDARFPLTLALGKDIEGTPVVANLGKMPHLLIAGTTGSGKSVAINTMILSLLFRLSPQQCRLIMIDPKMLELSVYDDIPHLLAPVVTDPKKAIVALKWVVAEMEERYRKMSKMAVRNIDSYNARVRDALEKGEDFSRVVQTGFDEETGEPIYETETFEPEEMPFIVVIVDEMADLMMVAGKEIEACIQRLAQMARASGIHLIMATQRPSVDVITGTIKANFPTRISFQVTSKIDSRTILGEQGAEQLLGMGDMLYMAGGGRIRRVHGPFVSDEEVEEVVRHLKSLGQPDYVGSVTEGSDDETSALVDEKLGLGGPDSDESHYDRAVAIVARDRKCSTSYIQRKLGIGYNRAARLVEQMEAEGVVSPANAVGKREILIEER